MGKENLHYENWEEYILTYFDDKSKFTVEIKEYEIGILSIYIKPIIITNENFTLMTFRINSEDKTKLKLFRFDNQNTFVVNFGVYSPDNNYNVTFLQDSLFEPTEEILFNEQNINKVQEVMKIPLLTGWIEEQYAFKNELYKTKIFTLIGNKEITFEINVLGIGELDIPLPFDRLFAFLHNLYISLNPFKKNISKKVFTILPILNSN